MVDYTPEYEAPPQQETPVDTMDRLTNQVRNSRDDGMDEYNIHRSFPSRGVINPSYLGSTYDPPGIGDHEEMVGSGLKRGNYIGHSPSPISRTNKLTGRKNM